MNLDKKKFYEEKYSKEQLIPSKSFPLQIKYVVDRVLCNKPTEILDLGGGSGEYSLILQSMGYDIALFDFSQNAVELAKKIGVLKTKCADFWQYDFKNEKYDIVLMRGFSLLNTDNADDFNQVLNKVRKIKKESGNILYWAYSDLSGKWSESGWYNITANELENLFNQVIIFPFIRYQLLFPAKVNIAISNFIIKHNIKLRKSMAVIGII